MFFIKETEVSNFANDTTICPCSLNKMGNNSKDTHIVLSWFLIFESSMVANPAKFLAFSDNHQQITTTSHLQ